MNYAHNLVSHAVFPGQPWEFTGPVPEEVRGDKKARLAWITNAATRHNVYSLVEGVNPNCRVYLKSQDDEGNPPKYIYGFTGDYEAPVSDSELAAGLARLPVEAPTWMERSLSGNAHFLWLLERRFPVPPDADLFREFMAFVAEKMRLETFVVGFDSGAFCEPSRRFINSGEWKKLVGKPLPFSLVEGWFIQFVRERRKSETEYEIPFDALVKRLEERHTRFAWPGDFVLGSQGPSFWVPGSQSPTSAIVRPDGMFTFAEHADKPFYSWPELCGVDWCEQYKTEAAGRAVEGIYHDSRQYWRQLPTGRWRCFNKDDTMLFLQTERRVSSRRDARTRISPMDEALLYIQQHHSVDGAAPFLFRDERILEVGPARLLNLARTNIILPVPGPVKWDEQNFPFLYPYFTRLFSDREAYEVFMAWLSRFYRSAYFRQPCGGQALFLCGITGVGKTLCSTIVGLLMGGRADAAAYLLGEDPFGSELFWVSLWAMDDQTSLSSAAKHRRYCEAVKKVTANVDFRYHEKFKIPAMVIWPGRIIITLNNDEESLRALPDTSISNKDKIHLIRAADAPPIRFPERHEIEAAIRKELPAFARVLLDWQTPPSLLGDSRYGLVAYHDPRLLQSAQQSSSTAAFHEILDDWQQEYFRSHPDRLYWEGTGFQLHKAILADPTCEAAMKAYDIEAVGRALASLKAKGLPLKVVNAGGEKRVWRIPRPSGYREVPTIAVPSQADNSEFGK